MTSKFKVGDRVKYTSGQWSDAVANPLWGGMFGRVIGTVTIVDCDCDDIRVRWDNNTGNNYYNKDLELVDTFKPVLLDNSLFEV